MKRKFSSLQKFYFIILIILFIIVILTPTLIRDGFSFLEEDVLESSLIFLIFIINYIIFLLYEKEVVRVAKNLSAIKGEKKLVQDRLNDAFKYIGSVNVQIDAIKTALIEIKKYPENKKEMKQIIEFLANSILKIIPVDWVLLRILDTQNMRILRETVKARGSAVLIRHEISNKDLLENTCYQDYQMLSSSQNNVTIKIFSVFPKFKVSKEQKIMIEAILNQLQMLFIIFDSKYFKYK